LSHDGNDATDTTTDIITNRSDSSSTAIIIISSSRTISRRDAVVISVNGLSFKPALESVFGS